MNDQELAESKLDIPRDFSVIVVDDDDDSRRTIKEFLISFGFINVFEARNGLEGYTTIQREAIDLVVSDWDMPTVSGIELLKTLKKEEAFKNIPFVMVTSPISLEQLKVEEAAAYQVDAYLTKPFRALTLKAKLLGILEEQRADQARGVLVVDDDNDVRQTMVEILTAMNLGPIYQAKNGEEGFQELKVKSAEIAMVISDWEMPKLKGIDFLRRVRADRELSNIAFLMVTSQSSIEHIKVDMAIQAEVDHYLIKPFKVEAFQTKVDTILKAHKLNRKVKLRLEDARKLIREGDYFNARRLYKHVQRLDPKNVDAYLGLAHAKLVERPDKGFDEAIYFVKEAMAINPSYDVPYLELAVIYERAASLDKAVAVLIEGATASPMSARIHYNLGRILLKLGRDQQAFQALQKSVELEPELQEAKQLLRGQKGIKK